MSAADAMTTDGPLFDEAALAELSTPPVDRVAAALAHDDETRARELADAAIRAWTRGIDGFRVWIVHTLAFLTERHGPEAAGAALGGLTNAMSARTPWPEHADAGGGGDSDAPSLLTNLRAAERALRREHDAALDAVCVVLSHVYRVHGIDTLRASMEYAGDRTLLAWMPRDLTRSPQDRVRTWTAMLHGNFATLRVEEDARAFTIVQDPCGSCGRQLAAGRHPGPLDLATVHEVDPITFGRGDTPIYRTHVAVMHFLVPEARLGVPWPVVACPRADGVGPCRIRLYKDPLDPAARADAAALRGAGDA